MVVLREFWSNILFNAANTCIFMIPLRVDPSSLSDLVVYADESGDHGLDNIDADYGNYHLDVARTIC